MDSLSLRDYLAAIRSVITTQVKPDVWVRAEISELKVNASGHCYLTLIEKEASGRMNVCAKVSAIIWSNVYRMMSAMFLSVTNQQLQPGMSVLVCVSPNFHEAFGFSLVISDIDPTFTLGDMARRRQEVIEKLKADGVWDMNRELPFPELPQRIAVISSETAAGFGDFINQLEQNQRQFKFYWHLFPAIMQGADAPASIMEALDAVFAAQECFDVVAIVRGGGASADMLAFDDYDLASCCAQFPLPILSGVGHERDTCVLDMVAYQRCKTPTAVGALLVDCFEQAYAKLDGLSLSFVDGVRSLLREENERLKNGAMGFVKSVPLALTAEEARLSRLNANLRVMVSRRCQQEENRLNACASMLKASTKLKLQSADMNLADLKSRLQMNIKTLISQKQNRLDLLEQKIELQSPQNLLKKGYSMTLKDGKLVRSAADLKAGDLLETRFAEGSVKSRVE